MIPHDLVSLHGYATNGWAVPPAVVAVVLGREALRTLLRRPRTDEAIEGGRYLLCGALWLAATALMLAAAREDVALAWARVGTASLACMPVFGWSYSRVLLTRGPPPGALSVAWVLTAWVIAQVLYTDTVIASMHRYWWGYYPLYGWASAVMLGINVGVSGLVSVRFQRDLFSAAPGSLRRRRNESFLVGLSLGTIAYVDFLACYGIEVYPFGYAALLGMLVVLSRGIRRYGLLDLTLTRASREVLRVTSDGMVAVDPDGMIQLSNPAARALLGGAELSGKSVEALDDLLTPDEHAKLLGAPSRTKEIERDGRVLELRNTPILGDQGHPAGTLYVVRDVTNEREAMRQLTAAKELAEQAAHQKTRFLTTMSHEIRTPLAGVLGTTELLLDTELDETQRRYAGVVRSSGEHLLAVVNDILDYSRLEAGGYEPRSVDFELAPVVRNAVELVADAARRRGLALEVSIAPALPRWVRGDSRALGQVLVNLVSNAIKFTPTGRVDVEVTGLGPRVEFRVRDTGIGIPEDQRHRLFRRFSQLDASTTRPHGGSGLGLAISQRLCEGMGGSIEVDSEPGRGSTFSFAISLPEGTEPVVVPVTEPVRARDLRGVRVLVADDNSVNQMVARGMLERLGVEVDVVGDGAAAVEAVRASAYDLVLMDCEMPVMDGYEATTRIRGADEGRAVPIVALTAHALPEERDRCERAGMADVLTKPMSSDELRSVITRFAPPPRPRADA